MPGVRANAGAGGERPAIAHDFLNILGARPLLFGQAWQVTFAARSSRRCSRALPSPPAEVVAAAAGSTVPFATDPPPVPHNPGQTDYITELPGQAGNGGRFGPTPSLQLGTGAAAAAARAAAIRSAANPTGAPPGGRMADVQEGDIYKVDRNRLFYLNTYRGFLIYDLTIPRTPAHRPPAGLRLPHRDVRRGQHRLRPAARRPLPHPGGRPAAVRAPQRLAAGDHRHQRSANPRVVQHHRHQGRAARGRLAQDGEHHLRGLVHAPVVLLGLAARSGASGQGAGLGLLVQRGQPGRPRRRSASTRSSRAAASTIDDARATTSTAASARSTSRPPPTR